MQQVVDWFSNARDQRTFILPIVYEARRTRTTTVGTTTLMRKNVNYCLVDLDLIVLIEKEN